VWTSHPPNTCCMPTPSQSSGFDHPVKASLSDVMYCLPATALETCLPDSSVGEVAVVAGDVTQLTAWNSLSCFACLKYSLAGEVAVDRLCTKCKGHYDTRWFKYYRDKLWLVYTQSVPVIFEPSCIFLCLCVTVRVGSSYR
jgi:hypothetical protein